MKKLVAVALSLILTVSCLAGLSLTTSAAWDGSYSVDYTGGTGTEADPYLISSEQDLALLAKKTNEEATDYAGCYFKLTMDLDLGGTAWAPIGHNTDGTTTFRGTFDGDGHTISGLNCQSENNFGGLFGKVQGATIKNLTVTGTLVSSVKYAGGIVGLAHKGSTIYNCHSEIASIKGTTAGGIAGRTQDAGDGGAFNVIKDCTSSSKVEIISGNDCYGGGIIGAAGAVEVTWCINRGDVTGLEGTTKTMMLGGIIGVQGASRATGHLRNCYNTGSVTALSLDGTTTYAGGLIGRAAHVTDSEIENSFNTGSVSVVDSNNAAVDGKYGSLIGHIRNIAFISNCYTSISYTDYPEVAADDFASVETGNITVLTEAQMKGPDAVTNMKLGAGWVSEASDYPSIDLASATDGSTIPEDTTTATPDTTPAPVETTTTPNEGKETTPVETTTVAPTIIPIEQSTTTAPAGGDNSSTDDGGPNVFVILIIVVVVLAAGAIAVVMVLEKKKK